MTEMFCYQCEQAAKGVACTSMGVCGKDAQTAALQDLLMHAAQGISWYAHCAGQLGVRDRDINVFVIEALFTTVTNVNFDPQRIEGIIHRGADARPGAPAVRAGLRQGRPEGGGHELPRRC